MDASNTAPSAPVPDPPPEPVSHIRALTMKLVLAMSGLALAMNAHTAEKFHRLRAAEIRSTLIGKIVTDESHWADIFQVSGTMGGHQLGQPQTGSWKLLRNGELCVVRKVRTAESDCFEVWMNHEQVQYRRDGILLSEGVLRNE